MTSNLSGQPQQPQGRTSQASRFTVCGSTTACLTGCDAGPILNPGLQQLRSPLKDLLGLTESIQATAITLTTDAELLETIKTLHLMGERLLELVNDPSVLAQKPTNPAA